MAAELVGGAFLSAALQVAFERLASVEIKDYFRGRKRSDGLLQKLRITLISVNQVLEDAEERQYRNTNVKQWLDELKDAVYVADDLLDEIAFEATRKKVEAESQTATSKVRGLFTSFVNSVDKEIESRIQEVFENLDDLAKQKDVLGLKEGSGGGSDVRVGGKVSNRLPTTSLVDETKIYGRDGDKEKIIDFLLGDNERENQPAVISIVGLGGMGKTTLAQLVYNDRRMEDQFQLKTWVCISEEFDVVGITKTILSALHCSITGYEDLNQLQLNLKEELTGKKFLIVLDDVWNQDPKSWEALQVPFLCGDSGSKILVTTRNEKVAKVMESIQIYPLTALKEEDGWELFARHAFKDTDASTYKNLELIGRKIFKKCKELPLAIKAMGGLLRTQLSEQHWDKVLESDIWQLSDTESNIMPELRLSYHYLPSNLKRCFAFCSIFPKDCRIFKGLLIHLWMAEGLLHCHQGNKSAEELGDEFLRDLESRSFFQKSFLPNRFIMHDLVNDLAKSVSGEFSIRIEGGKVQNISTKVRYFSYSNITNENDKLLEPIYKCKLLRSFVPFQQSLMPRGVTYDLDLLSRLKYLRILSFSGCENIIELGDDISNLKHLRYLDLSETQIQRLPDSICTLYNLQTLILCWCYSLVELPRDMYKLINLRHLDLSRTKITEMPMHMGRLKHLQILTDYFVSKHNGSNIRELGGLNPVTGSLSISQLENINDVMDARVANIRDKKCLDGLRLRWCGNNEDSLGERSVLEALQPHVNLKGLTVEGYSGTRFADWFDSPYLPNLVSLELSACKYCYCLPPLGQLPSLEKLTISELDGINKIGPDFYGNDFSIAPFRSLECLRFEYMTEWEEWVHVEGECFPCLEQLCIENCPKLTKSLPPHLTCLKTLRIRDCEKLEPSLAKEDAATNVEIQESQVKKSSWMEQVLDTNPYLEYLYMDNCPQLVSFPTSEFSALNLKYIYFFNLSNLKSLPENMQTLLPSLHTLRLYNCPQIESFPKGGLPSSLVDLTIYYCPKLFASRKEWGLHNHRSLKSFVIGDDIENVESFPEEALLPPNLTNLTLEGWSNLKTLNYKGLLHLESLQTLRIFNCPSLQCLPDEGLPNSISRLSIGGNCPLLKQRCQKENGHDWHKISHIPDLYVGSDSD